MAARWAAGEEILTACNMDLFHVDSLDETAALSSGETLEALQSCLDPSILSIFEDTPTIEAKGLDEESEATLLTALTEILDNVDEENLSPFDTLPESELLSGQKGREHSPLRRLLCLSRSPPEKDALCSATGKSLPRILANCLQRSDGEEEDDGSLSLSPVTQMSSPDSDLLDWEGLTASLPVTFEQEGEDGLSLSLGDLVRHMHPYCMAICMENDEGEQMLPEGGILLEVVDQGENGEPILAIPDMDLPCSVPLKEQPAEIVHKVSDEAEDAASDSSEHIVVVDDDEDVTVTEAPVKLTICVKNSSSGLIGEVIKGHAEEIKSKSPSRRKKKKKCKEQSEPRPAERRVLRSGKVRNVTQEPLKTSIKEEKKQKPSKIPTASAPASVCTKPQKLNRSQTESQKKIMTTALLPETKAEVATPAPSKPEKGLLNAVPEKSQPICSPPAASSPKPDEVPTQTTPEKPEVSSVAPPAAQAPVSPESPAAAPSPDTPQKTPPVSKAPVPPAVSEPKPKALSLAEYRRLRQQKKPAPVENKDSSNSTKWPSLPEPPKELPPIPCLPDPTPKDPRRTSPQAAKKEPEEVRPAWQPRGPCAPPTPEALLVPPSYMAASSSKIPAAAPKPQQTPEPSKPSPPQNPPAPAPVPVKNTPPNQPATAVPQSAASPASLKPDVRVTPSTDRQCSPALSQGKGGVDERPLPVSPKSVDLTKTCLTTTTEAIKPAAAVTCAPSASHKITQVSPKVPVATTPTSLGNRTTFNANGTKAASAAHTSVSQSLKAKPVVLEAKEKLTNASKPQRARNPTQELIEAFTAEMGIEAADLTSLLEQFEETQAKVEHCVPEVSGRAAAVGNSSVEFAPEKKVVERVRANDLSSTAALTPPATPPHQMWKPLAPMALLGKSKATEASKSSPSKVIQIEARPLPSARGRSKPTPPAPSVPSEVACLDHDYCLPSKAELGKRWNVKQQSFITIKPIKPAGTTTQTAPASPASPAQQTANAAITTKTQDPPQTEPLDNRTDGMERSSVLETPDASPSREVADTAAKEGSPSRGSFGRSYRRHATCRTPSPMSSPKERTGRSRKRRSRRSPSSASSNSDSDSDSHSSRSRSRSRSPSKKRYRPRHSRSSSRSSSRSYSRSPSVSRSPPRRRRRYSYSSSRSGSWSRSRSRSQSPQRWAQWSRGGSLRRSSCSLSPKTNVQAVKRYKEKAIEERRVVYVGRIRGTMTQKELKERFSYFGEIEDCTLHFREQGDNYGFVTYYNKKDAFTAIENGSKLRKPDELPFDLCFGGRRQFCQTSYADLDSSREYEPLSARGKLHALDFDTLLKQAQQSLKR